MIIYTHAYILSFLLLGENDSQSCCQDSNFKKRCHFLCDGSDSTVYDELACGIERIDLLSCKAKQSKF